MGPEIGWDFWQGCADTNGGGTKLVSISLDCFLESLSIESAKLRNLGLSWIVRSRNCRI